MISFPIVLINIISIVMICCIIYAGWRRRSNTGAVQLIHMSAFMLIWAFCSIMEMVVKGMDQKVLWRNLTMVGIAYATAESLIFSITYSEIFYQYKKKLSYILFILQTLGIILVFTDKWSHLVRYNYQVVRYGANEKLIIDLTMLGNLLTTFDFLCMLAALGILIVFAFTTTKSTRKQVICVIFGIGIAVAFSLFKVVTGGSVVALVPVSGAFAVASFVMLLGIARYDLMRAAPIGRSEVFHIIDYGIMIAQTNGKFVDANQAAIEIFHLKNQDKKKEILNIMEQSVKKNFPEWQEALTDSINRNILISMEKDNAEAYFECNIYSLRNKRNKIIGSISMLKNITEQKLKNDLLQYRAERDGLTGTYNRQTFVEKVEHHLQDYHKGPALIYFDIDKFKDVNDIYGHMSGDFVLKEVCNCIGASLPQTALFGRMGGEEFAIFTSTEDASQLFDMAEEYRKNIENHIFNFDGRKINITISIGVAIGKNLSFDDLYHKADMNLYKAKKSGRNCVVSD